MLLAPVFTPSILPLARKFCQARTAESFSRLGNSHSFAPVEFALLTRSDLISSIEPPSDVQQYAVGPLAYL